MQIREIPYRALEAHLPAASPYVLLKTGHVTERERWSILGWDPWRTWMPNVDEDPCVAFDAVIADAQRMIELPAMPMPVPLLMGAISYDLAFDIESIPACAQTDIAMPKMIMYGFRRYRVVDEYTKRCWEITIDHSAAGCVSPQQPMQLVQNAAALAPRNFSRSTYCAAVAAIREMICNGDCYQVNLSQRFVVPTTTTAAELFQYVCQHNPAPMMAFIDTGPWQLISTSPERFLKRHGTRCISEPIKGTTARHVDLRIDAVQSAALFASEKNRAELAMIVDLIRNDLGRLAQTGSVRVEDPCRVESYTNVHHLVATISAEMNSATPWSQLLRALFPGGSITGCPKIQAMRVIEQLEHMRRGFYCGSIGYIDAQGGGDWNIAIRTMTQYDGHVSFHVGGGVVYDSDPAAEYEETLRKGETLFNALHVTPDINVDRERK